jgi:hypothetical protein
VSPKDSEIGTSREREVKPGKSEKGSAKATIRARVAYESERRARLGVPAFAGGVLFLLGGIIVSTTLKALPTVGPLQAVAPALRGEPDPAVSPGAAEVRFIDHHAFGLLAGNVLQAVAILIIVLVLLFLQESARFRRPEMSRAARPLVLVGGAVMVLVSIAHPAVQVLNAHSFVGGHDFDVAAVNRALTRSAALEVTEYLGLLGGLVLAAGMVVVVLGASRTGLMARWMMMLGIFMALLAFTPFGLALGETAQLIPAFWMVATGMLLTGRWPGGDPPAWVAGEARPWPSGGRARAERDARRAGGATERAKGGRPRSKDGAQQSNGDVGSVAPEPVPPTAPSGASGRRRRKRGSRG